jgi:hypothetical protein
LSIENYLEKIFGVRVKAKQIEKASFWPKAEVIEPQSTAEMSSALGSRTELRQSVC